jgi:hypothetical protein
MKTPEEIAREIVDGSTLEHGDSEYQKALQAYENQVVTLECRIAALEKALEPFAKSVGNEIRITEDNTKQVFYNFIPTGYCSNAVATLLKDRKDQ